MIHNINGALADHDLLAMLNEDTTECRNVFAELVFFDELRMEGLRFERQIRKENECYNAKISEDLIWRIKIVFHAKFIKTYGFRETYYQKNMTSSQLFDVHTYLSSPVQMKFSEWLSRLEKSYPLESYFRKHIPNLNQMLWTAFANNNDEKGFQEIVQNQNENQLVLSGDEEENKLQIATKLIRASFKAPCILLKSMLSDSIEFSGYENDFLNTVLSEKAVIKSLVGDFTLEEFLKLHSLYNSYSRLRFTWKIKTQLQHHPKNPMIDMNQFWKDVVHDVHQNTHFEE